MAERNRSQVWLAAACGAALGLAVSVTTEVSARARGRVAARLGRVPHPQALVTGWRVEWPREESNLRAQVRSLPLYPLSYGAVAATEGNASPYWCP